MLSLRSWLLVVVVLATALFVVGVSVERSGGEHSAEAAEVESSVAGGEAGEAATDEDYVDAEAEAEPEVEAGESNEVLGLDPEATPFVALAVLLSIGLAAAAWLRPRSRPLLAALALAMLVFAVLDVGEVFHQSDESETGLALLAVLVAALHLAASAISSLMWGAASRADA